MNERKHQHEGFRSALSATARGARAQWDKVSRSKLVIELTRRLRLALVLH